MNVIVCMEMYSKNKQLNEEETMHCRRGARHTIKTKVEILKARRGGV